jgi:Ser/Thr protein kinase RdoA (MazF antagonist)
MVDRDAVARVLDHYGLRPTGRMSARDGVVRIATTGGRKALTRYPAERPTGSIASEHSILRHLEAIRFPADRVGVTDGGETVVQVDGDRFALYDDVPGRSLSNRWLRPASKERWARAGALLATFHRRLEDFTPAGGPTPGSGAEPERDTAWHLATLEALANERPPASNAPLARNWRWLREQAPRIAEPLARLGAELDHAPLSRTVVHGGFGPRSVRFPDRGPVLVDLERAHVDRRLVDHVDVLRRAPAAASAAFMEGYDATYGPPDGEWRSLPQLWRYDCLCRAVRSWQDFVELGDERRLRSGRAWVEEADRVAATATSSRVG